MSNLPPTHIAQIDAAIQEGRGAAASVLGQTYDIYRISTQTNNAVITGSPSITGFQARIRKSKKVAIENTTFDLEVFEATCDNRNLELQDILVQTGYGNDGSVFTMAQKRPTRETLWVRTEYNVSLARSRPDTLAAAQLPDKGNVFIPGFSAVPRDSEQVLTLKDGMFAFSSAPGSIQASVPAGLQPLNRVRDGSSLAVSTALYREHFLLYLPLLPGEQLNEMDRVYFPNSDRYELALIFSTDLTGLSGYICIAEKLA